jgi:hypothetical protein
MKKYFRRLVLIFSIPVLLAGILVLTAWIFRDELASKIFEELNQQIDAKLEYKSYQLSPFRQFPDMSLQINGLNVVGNHDFEGDTLIDIAALNIRVDLWSLFRPPFMIESLTLRNALIHAKVLKNGSANWWIFPEETAEIDTSIKQESSFQVELQRIHLIDSRIVYEDEEAAFFTNFEMVNADLEYLEENSQWQSEIAVSGWDATVMGIQFLQRMEGDLDGLLDFDSDSLKVSLDQGKLKLNKIAFDIEGFVAYPDTSVLMKIDFHSAESTFKQLLSLVPMIYSGDFESIKAKGTAVVSGKAEGIYDAIHFPQTDLVFRVSDGAFSYPELPKSVSSVFIDLAIINKDGTFDGTTVDLSDFRALLGSDPIDLKFFLKTPERNPTIKAGIVMDLDLSAWREFFPLEQADQLAGKIAAELFYSGNLNDARNKRFEKINASGSLTGEQIVYKGSLIDKELSLDKLSVELTPEKISIHEFEAKAGRSDFLISGTVQNYLPWFIDNAVLKSELEINSELIDMDEWFAGGTSEQSEKEAETVDPAPIQIPKGHDAKLQLDISHLVFKKYDLETVRGKISIKDGAAVIDPVDFKMLGGAFQIAGSYKTEDINSTALVDLDMKINDVQLEQTVQTFNTVKKLAPIASRCSGNYSAGLKISGDLSGGYSPVLSSLNGLMRFQTEKLQIEQADIFKQVGQLTGSAYFDSPTLSKVNALVEFRDGSIAIKPFTSNIKQAELVFGGTQGLDGSLDYKMEIQMPSSEFQFEKSKVAQQLFDLPLAQAVNLKWPEKVQFDVLIKGTIKDTKVGLSIRDQARSLQEEIVEQFKGKLNEEVEQKRAALILKAEIRAKALLEEANKQGDLLVEEAVKQAEFIKGEANRQIDQLKSEADRKAEALISNAGANPLKKLAAHEAAALIRSEAQKNADQLRIKTETQANRGIDAAIKQKQTLMNKARKEGETLIQEARTMEF